MTMDGMELAGTGRSQTWRWLVCGLLLLATVVNYMDRLTVNTLSGQIQAAFHLDNAQYGQLEFGFGLAFAVGGIFTGILVDRVGVYWLFPVVLLGWSVMGFLTGLSRSFGELLVLRTLLGLFEAGHFPCGLKCIQLLLTPRDRALGNSLLQSGTAVGAIAAQPVIRFLATAQPDGWRAPFLVVGAAGCAWIVLWFLVVRSRDLPVPAAGPGRAGRDGKAPASFLSLVGSTNFLALALMVICVNLNWHFYRVWLPKFLQEARGYSFEDSTDFMMWYYLAAGIGSFAAGAASGALAQRGLSVHAGRMVVYACCCVMTLSATAAAVLPAGPVLLRLLLVVGMGGLGAYTAFYSLTQDLSMQHQGKLSGSLTAITWLTASPFHWLFGRYLDQTHDYDTAVALIGWLPLLALGAVLLLWRPVAPRQPIPPPKPAEAVQPASI